MIIVKYKDKRSLVVLHDSKDGNSRNEGATIDKFNTRVKERLCESADYVFQDRKLIATDYFTNIPLLANDRIGVAKHDSELCYWKVTTDKSSNTDALHESDSEWRKDNTDETLQTKKKKKRRFLTICTANCKYDVVRRVAMRFGMREVTEDSSWDLYWTDMSISLERAKDMKRFQKINHFPGMTEICRKDLLARNLNRMQKLFPKDYNFFPKTWCFPADHGDALTYDKLRRTKTFIIKPDSGCQGRGIYLTKHLKDINPNERMICQVYIARPFLIDGYKFDLRIYALITSCDPLRIFVYNEGLARFATSKYKEPSGHNTSNIFMHLTNYSVNKHSRMYNGDDEIGSKRKISTLNKWFEAREIDVKALWGKIDGIIIKTVLAAYPVLKHSYHACFPTHDKTYACFELLGFDVLLDWNLRPYLLEVNHSPSFHTDAQIDKDVKEGLLMNTFDMLNLQQCDKKKIIEEDRKRIRHRLFQGISNKETQINDPTASTKLEKSENNYMQRQFQWEDDHIGNFRRIYPCPDKDKYQPFFVKNALSVFQDTVASRAREEALRIEKEENELKTNKWEDRKRLIGKNSESKLGFESSSALKKSQERPKYVDVSRKTINKQDPQEISVNALHSFEPEIISESEEKERIAILAQRDFLVKSCGIIEQIYLAMKRNGTLRLADERKYGTYGRLGLHTNAEHNACSTHKSFHHRKSDLDAYQIAHQYYLRRHHEHKKAVERTSGIRNTWLTWNEALVYVRPKIPQKLWMTEMNCNHQRSRVTKAHVARALSNSVRLHMLERRGSLATF